MAIAVKVPKDSSNIKTKVAFNLTKRQLICFGTAVFVGLPVYIFTKGILGTDISAMLMMAVMVPLFLLAMYERNGMPAEKVLEMIIRQKYILPGIRRFKSENLYLKMEEREKMKKEVMRLEAKAERKKAGERRKQEE